MGRAFRKRRLVVIAGPTAGGKSARALEIAEQENGVVINADASQLYRDLDILSARPDEAEEARTPHRLYGVRDGADPCSAAQWADMAKAEIEAAHAEDRLPILVGGTGLYFAALLDGIAPIPEVDPAVREAVRALSTADLAAALGAEDETMAARLHPNDTQRLARALEVRRSSGRSLADWQAETPGGLRDNYDLHIEIIDPPRAELAERCDARFDDMMAAGALGEVEALLARALSPQLPVMKAIGAPPLAAHLKGEITLAAAIERAKRDTLQYAKRQRTWFRNRGV
ncbi:MAG: tRNA (adenosine(37)-N6)-dimethylallyltransferase MiaA [Pacificimonas sp.]